MSFYLSYSPLLSPLFSQWFSLFSLSLNVFLWWFYTYPSRLFWMICMRLKMYFFLIIFHRFFQNGWRCMSMWLSLLDTWRFFTRWKLEKKKLSILFWQHFFDMWSFPLFIIEYTTLHTLLYTVCYLSFC